MKCERCGEAEATIISTTIVDNAISKIVLCTRCHEDQGGLAPLLEGTIADVPALEVLPKVALDLKNLAFSQHFPKIRQNKQCPDCGMTLDEFRKRRVLGCPTDYVIFKDEMEALLERLHAGTHHRGRLPQALEMRRLREERVGRLRGELDRAVADELYEEAARLRDRIDELGGTEEPLD